MAERTILRHAVFSPEHIASINRAYKHALDTIGGYSSQDDVRARLAENVMFLARSGETDEEKISALAVIRTLGRKPTQVVVYTGL